MRKDDYVKDCKLKLKVLILFLIIIAVVDVIVSFSDFGWRVPPNYVYKDVTSLWHG